jgi:hypothetical protein
LRRHPTCVSALGDISSVPDARLVASIDRHHLDIVTASSHDLDEHERSIAGVDSTINMPPERLAEFDLQFPKAN